MAEPGVDIEMDLLEIPDDAVNGEPYYGDYEESQSVDGTIPEAPDPNSREFRDTLARRIQAIQDSQNKNRLPGVININERESTAYEKETIVEHYKNFIRSRGAVGEIADTPQFRLEIKDYNSRGHQGKVYALFYDDVPLSNDGKF